VIGGGIGGHGADVLLGAVHDQLTTMTPFGPPRIETSVLGDDAVVLGALATGLANARQIVLDSALGPRDHTNDRPSATSAGGPARPIAGRG
jgi:hypothetical protein